jgi:membrane-associated protease RseP (regulator of RpoE activity)
MSIDTLLVRGGVAALLAAATVRPTPAQVIVSTPAGRALKDSLLVRVYAGQRGDSVRVVRISLDSIRDLVRAWESEPLMSLQSELMARRIEALLAMTRTDLGAGPRMLFSAPDGTRLFDKGWLGLTTGGVHDEWTSDGHFLRYFDYPPIVSVSKRSPAQLAGIIAGDTLIAYDGVDVVGHPINLTQLLTPEKKLGVTVRRDGEMKAFTVIVGRQPNDVVFTKRVLPGEGPPFPMVDLPVPLGGDGPRKVTGRIEVRGNGDGSSGRIFMMSTPDGVFFSTVNGVFGASLSAVGPELAKKLKTEPGVLVNEVPEDTPAARAGLKAGDVIVRVAGEPVATIEDVRTLAMLRGENHTVTLQIIRDQKPRTITVK